MPALHVEKTRPIDWLHCFFGLISCDFNGKKSGNGNAVGFSNVNGQVHDVLPTADVRPFTVCGGANNVESFSVKGCQDDLMPCLVPYDDVAELSLTYTPTVAAALHDADETFTVRITLNGADVPSESLAHPSAKSKRDTDPVSQGAVPVTLTAEMQFGEDMVGQDVSVRVELMDEEDVILCAAMNVLVTQGREPNEQGEKAQQEIEQGYPYDSRLQQPIVEDL